MRYHIERKKGTGFGCELEATVEHNCVTFIIFMQREDYPELNEIRGYIAVEHDECAAFLRRLLLELESRKT
jgi:hypothetical protein